MQSTESSRALRRYVRTVRTTYEFDFVTTAMRDQVIELMTDFSPDRPRRWPASSTAAFEVYRVGQSDAEIREGQDFPMPWARWRYDWSTPGTVTLMAAMRVIGPRFLSSYYKKVYDNYTPPSRNP